jgi:pimeloyl-ACP methyl ester carboxylesterase
VFLHGWGLNRDSLRGIGILFQHAFRVHLIDLPGFGDAPAPPPEWDTSNYARLVEQYLATRVPGEVILVGHSFGGRVSLRIAAKRLPQLTGVVLMGVPGLPSHGWSRRRVKRLAIRMLRQLLHALAPMTGPSWLAWHTARFGSKDYLAAGALRPILIKSVNEDLTDSARTSACPFLLIYGTDDTETPPWLGWRYRELMSDRATLELLPHKDHHLYSGTGAHLCAFKIRQWIDGLGTEARAAG